MIEKFILDYLNDILSVSAYMEKPPDEPEEYVLIEKTGGGKENYIKSASIALQSYADSLFRAAELNEEVKLVMDNIIELDVISGAGLARDYNFTDTTKKKYRYQAIYEITHY